MLRVAADARVPVTAAAGRSGVCGASVPVHGGIVLDLTGLSGIVDVDDTSLVLDVRAGTFGTPLEDELRATYGKTLGHWPQSIDLSTVGGWLACRSAGQYSNRYGKIEDMVVGLDVVLADGRRITTGGAPRQAVGPDLNQVFVGSEGTLGVITGARLRVHPAPEHDASSAWAFTTFADGLELLRRVIRRGATPAVLRLYDATEADRTLQDRRTSNLVLARDEGDPVIVDAAMRVLAEEAKSLGAQPMDAALVDHWMEHRNDVAALEALISRGFVVDTMEIAGRWSDLAAHLRRTPSPRCRASPAHSPRPPTSRTATSTAAASTSPSRARSSRRTRTGTTPTSGTPGSGPCWRAGGALSHHHGVGLNRSPVRRRGARPGLRHARRR